MSTPSTSPPQIYDSVAPHYDSVLAIPGTKIIYWMLDRFFTTHYGNDLSGRAVLELACGTGDCARKAHALGAHPLVGVDVSREMIRMAREIEKGSDVAGGIEYLVADCSGPIAPLRGREARFDLVLGNWLLSYARSYAEVVGMWRNVFVYLKPGGRFVGAFTGFDAHARGMATGKYGARGRVAEEIAGGRGVRVALTFMTEPVLTVDVFILERQMYVDAAREVGFEGVEFQGPSWECLPAGESREYWADEMESPSNIMFAVTKPE